MVEERRELDHPRSDESEQDNSTNVLIIEDETYLHDLLKIVLETLISDVRIHIVRTIEESLVKLKEAHKNKDLAGIETSMNELNAAWQAASQDMYAASGQPGADGAPGPEGQPGGETAQDASTNDEVTDVDFEEVK